MSPSLSPPAPSHFEAVVCYYCGSGAAAPFITAQDDLTGKPGEFTFVRCKGCGLVYQSPRLSLEHIKAFYDDEYIAHRKKTDWGWLTWFYNWAMEGHDRRKEKLVRRFVSLGPESRVLDVGAGAGTFLARLRRSCALEALGIDFKDLTHLPSYRDVEFRLGLFYEQELPRDHFDLITMWHFLEHDYDPFRSLCFAREIVRPSGRLIVEVPRLDCLSFGLYGKRWPGLQAPQHTVLYSKQLLSKCLQKAGWEVVAYLPYGAFPAYFYLFTGLAFKLLQGKGLNLSRAIYPYFAGQILLAPVLLFERQLNLAMQTVVCRRAS